jgi:uncharacterized membrane protein YkvA (DUF1232 family)
MRFRAAVSAGIADWKARLLALKSEVLAVSFALADPRTPWHARLLAALIVGYAACPIDLIPDFIPVLGVVDDLILVPLGIALVIKWVPGPVMEEARARARAHAVKLERGPTGAIMAVVVIAIWIACGAWVVVAGKRLLGW